MHRTGILSVRRRDRGKGGAHGLRDCRVKERTSGVIRAGGAFLDQRCKALKKGTPPRPQAGRRQRGNQATREGQAEGKRQKAKTQSHEATEARRQPSNEATRHQEKKQTTEGTESTEKSHRERTLK
jgi:hypothetical protein